MAKGLAEYPVPTRNGQERKGAAFANKEEAIRELREVYCPFCGRPLILSVFKEQDSRHTISEVECENGHALTVTFRFTKWPDRLYTASRTIAERTADSLAEPPQKKRRRRRKKKTNTEQKKEQA